MDPIDDIFGMRLDLPEEEKKSAVIKPLIVGKKLVIKNFKKPTGGIGDIANVQ